MINPKTVIEVIKGAFYLLWRSAIISMKWHLRPPASLKSIYLTPYAIPKGQDVEGQGHKTHVKIIKEPSEKILRTNRINHSHNQVMDWSTILNINYQLF